MTIHYNVPAGTTAEDAESLSPSDGYFGGRSAGVPDTMFVPTQSSDEDKAQQAGFEHSTSSNPVTAKSGTYTPKSSGATPASSQADSGSVRTHHSTRYRDIPAHAVPGEDEDAPPQYSETSTTGWSNPPSSVGSGARYQDEVNADSVREISTPLLERAFPRQYPVTWGSPQSLPVNHLPRNTKGRRLFSLPSCHKKKRGWCGGHHENKKQKFKCAVFVVLVTLIAGWLILQSALSHCRDRVLQTHSLCLPCLLIIPKA